VVGVSTGLGGEPPSDVRLSFDQVPELYDQVRPTYPSAVFDVLVEAVPPGARLVEIGPGTGKATGDLLHRGVRVTAVEIGPRLVARLRQTYADEERLTVVAGDAEQLDPAGVCPDGPADGLVSFCAYHWVDRQVQRDLPGRLVGAGGVVGIVDVLQVSSPADRGYFARVQEIYERYDRGGPQRYRPPPAPDAVVPDILTALEGDGRYSRPALHRWSWDQTYSADHYADLLRTYSVTRMMPMPAREDLVAELVDVVRAEFGGTITRPLVVTLTLARLL
jgi:SAM-dependent methyltransferase